LLRVRPFIPEHSCFFIHFPNDTLFAGMILIFLPAPSEFAICSILNAGNHPSAQHEMLILSAGYHRNLKAKKNSSLLSVAQDMPSISRLSQ